jgi:hypothetical protein
MAIWWIIALICCLTYTSAINCNGHYHEINFEYNLNFTDRYGLYLGSFLDSSSSTPEGKLLYHLSLTNSVDNSSFVVLYYLIYNPTQTPERSFRGKAYPCKVPPCSKWIDFDEVLNPSTLVNFTIESEGLTTGHLTLEVSYCKTKLNEEPSMSQVIRGLAEGYWISWGLAIIVLVGLRVITHYFG